jgi:uridine kinase
LALALGSCSPSKDEQDKTEPAEAELVKIHVGGCILAKPSAEVPEDLHQETDVIPTEEYKPFTKKLSVYGITLIGRDDISDDFMRRVAKTIKEIFPQNEAIDTDLQKEVLRNLYRYRTVIPLFKGEDYEFSPSDAEAWDLTTSKNSICDIIMEGVPGQVNEVVEHILHFVTDMGLHYTFTDEWGISKTSKIYHAMQEAIDKRHYIIEQYEEADEEEIIRVLIQEYAYWVIFTAWDLYEPYGPAAEWKGIKNPYDLMEKLPLSYELFEQTIPRVMAPPSRSTLEEFTK